MSTSPVPASAILAQGAPITLATGDVVHVRYGMLGLYRLEQDFAGSAANAAKHLQLAGLRVAAASGTLDEASLAAAQAYDGPGLIALLPMVLGPGLIGQRATSRTNPDETVDLGDLSQFDLLQYLDPHRLREYAEAFTTAFAEAFDTGEAIAPVVGRVTSASRSRTSTTSPAGARPARTRSSGA